MSAHSGGFGTGCCRGPGRRSRGSCPLLGHPGPAEPGTRAVLEARRAVPAAKPNRVTPAGQTERQEREQMKRERGCCQAPARAAAAVPHRKPGHTALPPPQRRSDSSGGGDQRAAERCQAPSCVEHTLLSAQVEPHRAPAAPLISTASLGNQFRPSLPARDVQTQGTRAKGNAELCHRHHH